MTYIGISAVWLKEHDAAIARKAREGLIDVIQDYLFGFTMYPTGNKNSRDFIDYEKSKVEVMMIIKHIESLRSTQHTWQEQPR